MRARRTKAGPNDSPTAPVYKLNRGTKSVLQMLDALRVTSGNIRSLGPAGALGGWEAYRVWLAVVDQAIAVGEGRLR